MLLHAADKSFQGTDKTLAHAANSKSVSGLARMIPDFQALGITIAQKFRWMSQVASTGIGRETVARGIVSKQECRQWRASLGMILVAERKG